MLSSSPHISMFHFIMTNGVRQTLWPLLCADRKPPEFYTERGMEVDIENQSFTCHSVQLEFSSLISAYLSVDVQGHSPTW